MNKILIGFLLFATSIFYGQEIERNKISQVFAFPGVDASTLFSKINFALALTFQNGQEIVKHKDDKAKRLIIKTFALIPVLDAYKLMNPKNTELSDYINYTHDYTVIIEAKDGKYRLQMIYEDGRYSEDQFTEYKLPFPALMDFTADDINELLEKATEEMKQDYYSLTSKKKKEVYIQSQARVARKYQQTLKEFSGILFQTLYNKIKEDINQKEW